MRADEGRLLFLQALRLNRRVCAPGGALSTAIRSLLVVELRLLPRVYRVQDHPRRALRAARLPQRHQQVVLWPRQRREGEGCAIICRATCLHGGRLSSAKDPPAGVH